VTVPSTLEPAGFDRYLISLVGSWRALAAPHEDARTWHTEAFVAARFPRHPVLNNAALLSGSAWPGVAGLYDRGEPYAIWAADTIWVIYRVIRGYLRFQASEPVPGM